MQQRIYSKALFSGIKGMFTDKTNQALSHHTKQRVKLSMAEVVAKFTHDPPPPTEPRFITVGRNNYPIKSSEIFGKKVAIDSALIKLTG